MCIKFCWFVPFAIFFFRSRITHLSITGFADTKQRDGNKYTNWHVMFTKISRICTKFGQSRMLCHITGICEWTVRNFRLIASNGI